MLEKNHNSPALIDESKEESWIFISNLRNGHILKVRTRNTLYTMKVIDPKNQVMKVSSNGSHIKEETECFFIGTTLTDTEYVSMIRFGAIKRGGRILLSVDGKKLLLLSSTQEISVKY